MSGGANGRFLITSHTREGAILAVKISRSFMSTMILAGAACFAAQGVAAELDHSWADDPRSTAPTTEGLEEFLRAESGPPITTGFGQLLGGWSWAALGIPGRFSGAGIGISWPYLYLANMGCQRMYRLDISSGAPEEALYVYSPETMPWGLGVDDEGEAWLGHYTGHLDYEYRLPGMIRTGAAFYSHREGEWMADISDNFPGDTLFQLSVGSSNHIYALHEPSGRVGRNFGHPTWDYISQRGLTYNSDCGTFFVGGWNSNYIWEISYADGSPIPGRDFACGGVSGLAYQDSACDGTAKLWVQLQSYDGCLQVYEIGPCDAVLAEETDGTRPQEAYCLHENNPDPFSTATTISYSLAEWAHVSLNVYDVSGRLVETLLDECQPPGPHETHWEAGPHANGSYFYRLEACPERSGELVEPRSRRAGSFVDTRKMVLAR